MGLRHLLLTLAPVVLGGCPAAGQVAPPAEKGQEYVELIARYHQLRAAGREVEAGQLLIPIEQDRQVLLSDGAAAWKAACESENRLRMSLTPPQSAREQELLQALCRVGSYEEYEQVRHALAAERERRPHFTPAHARLAGK